MWLVSLVAVLSLCSCCLLRGLRGDLVNFGLDALVLRWFTAWFYWFGAWTWVWLVRLVGRVRCLWLRLVVFKCGWLVLRC